MKLTAIPFDTATGELLPVYRDAYLRGDLARASAQAIDDYLEREAETTHQVVVRWSQPLTTAEAAPAPDWLPHLPSAVREQSPRFRRRVLSLMLMGLTLAGATMAASHLPAAGLPSTHASVVAPASLTTTETAVRRIRTTVLHGRILNAQGQPLAGATVRQKGTTYHTRTDASGSYHLRVPAGTLATLQCSHDGYTGQELSTVSSAPLR